jgi:hypothetical protein
MSCTEMMGGNNKKEGVCNERVVNYFKIVLIKWNLIIYINPY